MMAANLGKLPLGHKRKIRLKRSGIIQQLSCSNGIHDVTRQWDEASAVIDIKHRFLPDDDKV
jgi:hypothetical protein